MCIGGSCIGSLGAKSQENAIGNRGPSYLYLFNADSNSVGTPPADVISEDGSDAYEIVDAGGALGKGLRKKIANTSTKWALFNSYNVFDVPVKATFYFYMTDLSSYQIVFGVNLINGSNGGGQVTGLIRDAGTGNAKHSGWTANMNAGFLSSSGAYKVSDPGDYNYIIEMNTSSEFIAECWIDQVTNRQRMRISGDGGLSWFDTVEIENPKSQSRIGFLDGVGMTPQLHLKRVEVLPL